MEQEFAPEQIPLGLKGDPKASCPVNNTGDPWGLRKPYIKQEFALQLGFQDLDDLKDKAARRFEKRQAPRAKPSAGADRSNQQLCPNCPDALHLGVKVF